MSRRGSILVVKLNVFVCVEYTTLFHALSGRRLSMERKRFNEEGENPVNCFNYAKSVFRRILIFAFLADKIEMGQFDTIC